MSEPKVPETPDRYPQWVEWALAGAILLLVLIIGIVPGILVGICAYGIIRFVWWGMASNRGLHRHSRRH